MFFKFIFILTFPTSLFSFQFFYGDSVQTNSYDYKFETIIALTCKLPDIEKINKTVNDIFNLTNTKYPVPTEVHVNYEELIVNEYFVHLSLLNNEIGKIQNINQQISELPGFFHPSLPSPAHLTSDFEISPKFVNNSLQASSYLTKVITAYFQQSGTWDEFKANGEKFSGVIIQFRFIKETLEALYANLDSYYTAIKLAKQNIISDRLATAISTLEYNTPKTDIKIINSFSFNKAPTFFIKKVEFHNQKIGIKQVPILYNNFGLKDGYLLDFSTHKYIKPADNLLNYQDKLTLDKCLHALNSENFNDTLKFCEFQYSPSKSFVPTNEGILLYKTSQSSLNTINSQLGQTLSIKDLPAHVSFNGFLSFVDSNVGQVSYNRVSTAMIRNTSFSKDQIKFMTDYLMKKAKINQNNLSIPDIFEYKYLEILINIAAICVFFIILAILRLVFLKIRMRCKLIPMEQNILKMVRRSHI